MAKKKAVPFEGKESPEEEAMEHRMMMRGGKRKKHRKMGRKGRR